METVLPAKSSERRISFRRYEFDSPRRQTHGQSTPRAGRNRRPPQPCANTRAAQKRSRARARPGLFSHWIFLNTLVYKNDREMIFLLRLRIIRKSRLRRLAAESVCARDAGRASARDGQTDGRTDGEGGGETKRACARREDRTRGRRGGRETNLFF